MNEASQTCSQATLWDMLSATSSPAEDSGLSPSATPGGPTISPSGLEVVPALRSQRQAKAAGLMTLVTSGLIGRDSSASASLQQSLESRLMTRLDTAGSTLFKLTWKRRTTPLGRRYLERQALARRTSGNGFTSVPTPNARLMGGGDYTDPEKAIARLESGHQINLSEIALLGVPTPQQRDHFPAHTDDYVATKMAQGHGMANLNDHVMLATVPTPMAGSPATETYNAAGNNDYSRRIVELAAVPTPQTADENLSRPGYTREAMEREWKRPNRSQNLAMTSQVLATLATPRSEDSQCAGAHRGMPDTLYSQTQLAAVTTPSSCDWKDTAGMSESGVDPDGSHRTRLDQLPRQAQLADSGLTATGGTDVTASTGQLDPAYSRWLMGVPPEWDAFACTATQSLSRLRKRSSKRTAMLDSEQRVVNG